MPRQKCLVIDERFHRSNEIFVSFRFHHIGARTRFQHLSYQNLAVVDGEDQGFGVRKAGAYLSCCFDAVEQRQRVIDDRDVGLAIERLGDRVFSVVSFATTAPPSCASRITLRPERNYFMVVRDQNPGHDAPAAWVKSYAATVSGRGAKVVAATTFPRNAPAHGIPVTGASRVRHPR